MPFIPRPVRPPTRIAITCKLPQPIASLLKAYAEFLDGSQEYVVTETLQLAFRKDREFQSWLAKTHPEIATALEASSAVSRDQPHPPATRPRAEPAPARRAVTQPAAPAAAVSRVVQER
jgi:hypothetical protein